MFITYGDTFLPSPTSYDELYYELVRCHSTFDTLYALGLRNSSSGSGDFKEASVKLTNGLVNIRAITAHFSPKIDAWLADQQLSTPSEEQILEVVKSNYDSLTLKLQVKIFIFFHKETFLKKYYPVEQRALPVG